MSEEECRAKIVFVGNAGVGKTSIINRFTEGLYDDVPIQTIGGGYRTKTIPTERTQVILDLWDTAGSEQYRNLVPVYFRDSSMVLICFDITHVESFQDAVNEWSKFVHNNGPSDKDVIIVGCKADLESQRAVDSQMAETAANEIGAQWYSETSALTNLGIDDLFTSIATRVDQRGIMAAERLLESHSSCC
jgi:small GTP-binding protein